MSTAVILRCETGVRSHRRPSLEGCATPTDQASFEARRKCDALLRMTQTCWI